jgi:beta-aspartyl-peptidase (threonine type)
MPDIAIVVHGGAGTWPPETHPAARAGVMSAVAAGHAVLAAGGGALEAVQAAVIVLEDDPVFNAGRGAVLDEHGVVSLDASVMRGADRAAGSVAGLRGIRNPVLAARAVLDEGRHVMLVGEPAATHARDAGLSVESETWFVTEARQLGHARGDASRGGTVGAVARDARGGVAAATSTGGSARKHPGRVGDSPLIGAGTWADDATAAVSCTGDGEAVIRSALAHEVDALMRHAGLPLDQACDRALGELAHRAGTGGLIAVGAAGGVATPFTTPGMPRAWRVAHGEPVAAVARENAQPASRG